MFHVGFAFVSHCSTVDDREVCIGCVCMCVIVSMYLHDCVIVCVGFECVVVCVHVYYCVCVCVCVCRSIPNPFHHIVLTFF